MEFGGQLHDAVESCGCLLAILAILRGKFNLANEIVRHLNPLNAVAAGLVRGVDNYLFHKLTQEDRGQLCRCGVLPYNLQKTLDIERARKQRELDGLLARDKELDGLFERLYEDNVSQKISDARFAKMSQRYEQEQGENAKRIKALRLELKKSEGQRMDVDTFLETVRRYTNATEITQRMVAELIDHIDVYHAEKQDGVTTQRITIYYNCIGAFSVPDRRKIPATEITIGTRNGVAVSYSRSRIAV